MIRVKKIFFIYICTILLLLGGELFYISSRPNKQNALNNFINISHFFDASLYLDTFYLRHRDLKNIDTLFSYHPSLRESKIGTFVLKAPLQ